LSLVLAREFEKLVVDSEKEMKDAMHYVLFSRKDRSAMSVAFHLLQKLNIEHDKFIGPALALETMRPSPGFLPATSFKP
jgi:hypothetical protein